MKKRKKILSYVLSFLMIINMFPISSVVYANSDNENIEEEDTIGNSENTFGIESLDNISFDSNGIVEEEDLDEEIEMPAFSDSKIIDDVKVTVTASEGVFPKDAYLSVKSISPNERDEVEEIVEKARDYDVNVVVSYSYDIKVLNSVGEEIQPDNQMVNISFELDEVKDNNLEAKIYHISDQGQAESLDTSVKGETICAITDGFSYYTVEFTYDSMTYVLAGGEEISLNSILSEVGLSGDVTAASSSNSSLFSVSNATGEWILTSHQPFNSKETLFVTIDGIEYEIIVTDSNASGTIYASSLQSNTDIVLTGDTTLVMDKVLYPKSISGDYSLTVTGNELLYVVNNEGDAIHVKSLNCSAPLSILSITNGLYVNQDIVITNGLFLSAGEFGVVSSQGNIQISGETVINSSSAALYAQAGSISIEGNLNIDHTSNSMCIYAKEDVSLVGDVIQVHSESHMLLICFGDIAFGGNVTLTGSNTSPDSGVELTDTVSTQGSVNLLRGCNLSISGKYGLKAGMDILMPSGSISVKCKSGAAIFASEGKLKLNGKVVAQSLHDGTDNSICVFGMKAAVLTGNVRISCTSCRALITMGNLVLGGEIYIDAGTREGEGVILNANVASRASVIIQNESNVSIGGRYGLEGVEGITMNGDSLNVISVEGNALVTMGEIKIKDGLTISTPQNGRILNGTIVDANGKVAKSVYIERIPYKITYDAKGGSGSIPEGMSRDGKLVLPKCSFTPPSGKQFAYWYVQKAVNPSGIKIFYPGETAMISSDVTVEAVWKNYVSDTCTLTFTPGDESLMGSGSMPSRTVERNTKFTLPECGFTPPEGYTFKYWKVSSSTVYSYPGDEVYISKDSTVNAIWQVIVYRNFNFDMRGHGTQIPAQSIARGESATMPDDPYEEGWAFEGWYTNLAYTDLYDFSKPIDMNTTVYAKWRRIEAKDIQLNHTELNLFVGDYETLTSTLIPYGSYSDNIVYWTSSDPSVADVSMYGGVVALKPGKVTITAKLTDEISASCIVTVEERFTENVAGYTLSLSDSIGVNFFMELSNDIVSDPDAYMLFTIPQSGNMITQKVYLKDVQKSGSYYPFKCEVSAKEMTGKITGQIVMGDGRKGKVHEFSVKDYCEYIIEHSDKYGIKSRSICKSLLQYGAYTQLYFNYKTNNLPMELTGSMSEISSTYAYNIQREGNVKFVGASLILKTTTGLKLHFKGNGDFYVDGVKANTAKEGDYTVLLIQGIKPTEIGNMFEITCGQFSMKYGVLSYGYEAEKTSNESLKNLMRSMRTYYTSVRDRNRN